MLYNGKCGPNAVEGELWDHYRCSGKPPTVKVIEVLMYPARLHTAKDQSKGKAFKFDISHWEDKFKMVPKDKAVSGKFFDKINSNGHGKRKVF